MQYYFFILIAVVLLSLQFATNKAYGLRRGNSVKASLIFTTCGGLASSVVSLIIALISGERITFTAFSAVVAALIAIMCCTYTFIGFKIMALGSLSVFTMFLMLGGMLLPYLFGVLRLNEEISVFRVIGVILLAASLVFPVIAREKSGKSSALFIVLCLAVFCLNGGISIASKLHQVTEAYEKCGTASFSFISNLFNGIISGAALIFVTMFSSNKAKAVSTSEVEKNGVIPPEKSKNSSGVGAVALIILANACCNGVSYMLQLVSAGKVPASVMYPMMTGGSVVLTAVAGRLFFGEKPDKITLIGLALSFASTFLFLL